MGVFLQYVNLTQLLKQVIGTKSGSDSIGTVIVYSHVENVIELQTDPFSHSHRVRIVKDESPVLFTVLEKNVINKVIDQYRLDSVHSVSVSLENEPFNVCEATIRVNRSISEESKDLLKQNISSVLCERSDVPSDSIRYSDINYIHLENVTSFNLEVECTVENPTEFELCEYETIEGYKDYIESKSTANVLSTNMFPVTVKLVLEELSESILEIINTELSKSDNIPSARVGTDTISFQSVSFGTSDLYKTFGDNLQYTETVPVSLR